MGPIRRPSVHAPGPLLLLITATALLSRCDTGEVREEREVKAILPNVETPAPKPVKGHRFRIVADVNGNRRRDTLTERFVDPATGHEADKFIADASYDSLSARIWRMKPISFVECTDTSVGRLIIREGESFGLSHLVNEGDLNGDGRDELGWVGHWVDHSNVNTYRITSWNGSEWVQLASFEMWEWQLPDLPGSAREFGLIGQTGLHVSDTLGSDEPAADLVWRAKRGSIHVLGKTEEADLDTLTLKLAPLRH